MKDNENITHGYAPHLPTEVLKNQNIINISTMNPSELQKILNLVENPNNNEKFAQSNLELIMNSDKTMRKF